MMRSKMNEQQKRFDKFGNDVTDVGDYDAALNVVEQTHALAASGDTNARQIINDRQARLADAGEANRTLQEGGLSGRTDQQDEERPRAVGDAPEGDESKVNPNAAPLAETTLSGTARNDGGTEDRTRE